MTVVAAKKIVAVLIMKAVLLGTPLGGGERIPDHGWTMARWGVVSSPSGDVHVDGEQILTDTGAGLTLVFGPDEGDLRSLFPAMRRAGGGYLGGSAFGSGSPDVQEVVLDPRDDFDLLDIRISGYQFHTTRERPWPDGYISFPFPRDGSAYFLEQVEEDLYRRVELAAREGYAIDARIRALDPTVEVELDLTKSVLLGGKYEDTIRAWVGKPRLVRTSVGSTVPIEPGERVLLIWHSPLAPRPEAVQQTGEAEALGPPPDWAVGKWLVTAEGIEAQMTVHEDGQGVIPFPRLPAHIQVDASGRVSTGEQLVRDVTVTVTGALAADGTGSGVLSGSHGDEQAQVQWTATKIEEPPAEADVHEGALGPAEWAVGTWRVTAMDDQVTMTVREDGIAIFNRWPATARVGSDGAVGPDQDQTMRFEGRLRADGTGEGVVTWATLGETVAGVGWTATKIEQPQGEDDQAAAPAAEPVRLAQLGGGLGGGPGPDPSRQRSGNMRPMGLAVLLELRQWVYEPASQEMRQEFEPLARALEQATGGRARLDLQQTQTPAEEYLRVVPVAAAGDEMPSITVGDQQFAPVVALWLCNATAASNTWRKAGLLDDGARAVSFPLDRLYVPAGASILAESTSGSGKLVVLVPDEGGLIEPEMPAGVRPGLVPHLPNALPPPGAPALPFGERIGTVAVYGDRETHAPWLRVWGPTPADDSPRQFVDLATVPTVPDAQRPININVRDMQLRDVIRMLGQAADVNLIVAGGIDGEVEHLTLRNATVAEALTGILEPFGLEFTKQGNVYFVHKPGEGP